MRILAFRLTLVAISVGFSLVLGELFVRLVAPQPASWLAIYRSHPVLPFFSMLPNAELHVDTGETEWTVMTDADGFRIPLEPRPEADCRALWLGDSFTFGHGVEYEESFVGVIDAQSDAVRQVNAAVAGYGPVQYRQTLEYLGGLGRRFDRVFVVTYVGNDFHDTQWQKDGDVVDGILGNEGGLKSVLKRNLHVYRLVSSAYHALGGGDQAARGGGDAQLALPAAWDDAFLSDAGEQYAVEMRRMQAYADQTGLKLAFVILPTRAAAAAYFARLGQDAGASAATDEGASRPMLPIERARASLDAAGADYLDLTSVVGSRAPEEMFFFFDGHFTPEANRLVAAAIAQRFPIECEGPTSASEATALRGAGLSSLPQ